MYVYSSHLTQLSAYRLTSYSLNYSVTYTIQVDFSYFQFASRFKFKLPKSDTCTSSTVNLNNRLTTRQIIQKGKQHRNFMTLTSKMRTLCRFCSFLFGGGGGGGAARYPSLSSCKSSYLKKDHNNTIRSITVTVIVSGRPLSIQ